MDNSHPDYRNPKKVEPTMKVNSITHLQSMRYAMRSGELSENEYREYGSAIQDAIDDARD
tara:strand:- start:2153 stop:2332 length:180 start_codon:yes stop_codon:yes gene_type:complete